MGNVDSIPVVSQVKSLGQVIGGDATGARRTQENFADNCPLVPQTKSFVQVCAGDVDGARKTQEAFVKDLEKFGAVAAGVSTAVVGVAITPFTGPVGLGTSLIGAGASGVVSTYVTPNEKRMNWKKFGKETAKGGCSGFCPIVGDVAAQVLDNKFEGRPLEENLGTAAAVGAVSWVLAAGVGAAGKAAAKSLKESVKSAGKEVLKDTAQATVSNASKATMAEGSKELLKDTVASRVTKAAVPLVKGSVTNTSAQLTSNLCQGETWHKGLGAAAATGAVSSGVDAAIGKAGRSYGGSQKRVSKSERRSKTKAERAVLAMAAVTKGGAAGGTGKMTSNLCEGQPIMKGVEDTIVSGAVNSGVTAACAKRKKDVKKNKGSDTTDKKKKNLLQKIPKPNHNFISVTYGDDGGDTHQTDKLSDTTHQTDLQTDKLSDPTHQTDLQTDELSDTDSTSE